VDSLTQLTLGAAVGEAVAGKKAGAKAPLWGAALGTLPDLDVLADPFLSESHALVFHRSASHSLFFVAVVTALAGWGLSRLHASSEVSVRRWALLAGAVLLTHIGLDCLTTYGTQVFWPFSSYPVILGTVFIIDPLYTVPLATGLLASLWWPATHRWRRGANYIGLGLSSLYLLCTIGNKLYVEQVFTTSLQAQDLPAERVFTKPTAFNNLLWAAISEGEQGFYVGLYSLLDPDQQVAFRYVPKQHDLLAPYEDTRILSRLRQFSRGYYAAGRGPDGTLEVYDLRFGRSDLRLTDQGRYIFTFKLRTDGAGNLVRIQQYRPEVRPTGDLLHRFVDRIRGLPTRGVDTTLAPSVSASPLSSD